MTRANELPGSEDMAQGAAKLQAVSAAQATPFSDAGACELLVAGVVSPVLHAGWECFAHSISFTS
jgi:hypothetical protein